MPKWNRVGRLDFFFYLGILYWLNKSLGPFGLALTLYIALKSKHWQNPYENTLGAWRPRVSSGFLRYDAKFFFSFLVGRGGGVKIKVDGRSRHRTETCIVVLPYREPEGINSFNPGQPIPLQTLHVSTLVETAPTNHFFIYCFILIFYLFFWVVPKVKTKIRLLEMLYLNYKLHIFQISLKFVLKLKNYFFKIYGWIIIIICKMYFVKMIRLSPPMGKK